jgi:hypothetical protein
MYYSKVVKSDSKIISLCNDTRRYHVSWAWKDIKELAKIHTPAPTTTQLIPFHFLLKDSRFRRFSNVPTQKMDDSRSIEARLTPGLMIKARTNSIYFCTTNKTSPPFKVKLSNIGTGFWRIKVN